MITLQPDTDKIRSGKPLEGSGGCGFMFILMAMILFLTACGVWLAGSAARPLTVYGLAGLGVLFVIIWINRVATQRIRKRRFEAGLDSITLRASTDQARIGEPIQIELEASVRKTIEADKIRIALMFVEWVKYTDGTDTRQAVKEWVIAEEQRAGVPYQTGQKLRQVLTTTIPTSAMHTFGSLYNRCTWRVQVEIELKDLPNYIAEYPITVVAALAAQEDF